jgi:hypothetical protein
MDKAEIRLRIVEVLVPQATRVGIEQPEYIIKACTQMEKYVLDLKEDESQPDSSPARKTNRPARGTGGSYSSGSSDPTPGG